MAQLFAAIEMEITEQKLHHPLQPCKKPSMLIVGPAFTTVSLLETGGSKLLFAGSFRANYSRKDRGLSVLFPTSYFPTMGPKRANFRGKIEAYPPYY